ncbi:MAG TPA: hypothetical protein VKA98_03770 [Nitrososphaeraceae archaeon]|nr:hypothetical protein [Nitrososphaeraceae archaeon]
MSDLPYTLLFGNNFITDSPLSVKMANEVLFSLGEDSVGPYVTTSILDSNENTLIIIEKNNCIFCNKEFIKKKIQRDHVLLKDRKGQIMLESRVLDKHMILVSGIFSFKEFVLTATQNYLILPNGQWLMHNRTKANKSSVTITEFGIKSE